MSRTHTDSTETTETPTTPAQGRRVRDWLPGIALIVVALLVVGTAYVVRSPSPEAARGGGGAYDEFEAPDAPDVTTPPLPAASAIGIPLADGNVDATIARLEQSTATTGSPGTLSLLARLLLQRAAVTGDADTYNRAISALDRGIKQAPDDLALRAQRASARVTTHDWVGARKDAAFVLAINPEDPGALGAAYDAAYETGRYAAAGRYLDTLSTLAPDRSQVLLREARWAELHGNLITSAAFATRAAAAADADGAVGTARATYDLVIGKLALDEGRYDVAVGAYQSALSAAPGWHAALAGLGAALAASGDLPGAEAALAQAGDTVPLPGTLSALGDVRTALGDKPGAADAYGTVEVVAQLESVQQLFNRTVVLSRAGRGVHTKAAVAEARAELSTRKDVYGYDALGWALLANGQPKAAVRAADASLRLGTQDPRLLAHAGLAHAAAGDRAAARTLLTEALALSPTVDPVLMDRVRAELAVLGAGTGNAR